MEVRGLISVIVLFPKQEIARNIRNILVRSGFEVIGVCVTGAQVIQRVEEMEEGIVVCGFKYADMVYSELKEYLPDGIRMVLIASHHYLEEGNDRKRELHLVLLKVSDVHPEERFVALVNGLHCRASLVHRKI